VANMKSQAQIEAAGADGTSNDPVYGIARLFGDAKAAVEAVEASVAAKADTSAVPTTEQIQDIVGALLVAGTNVSLNYNDVAGTLTISATGGGGGLDAEGAQDAVGSIMAGSGLASVAYDDAVGTITVTVTTESVQDVVGALLTAGSGITLNYNDAGDVLTVTNSDRGSTAVATHEAAGDPHPQYETSAEAAAKVTAHAAATDPHGDRAYTDTQVATRAPTSRTVSAGTGLSGGGSLAADRTLSVDAEWLMDYLATTLVAGSNVTLAYDDTAGTITVAASSGSSSAVTLINGEYGTEPVTAASPPTITVAASGTTSGTRIAPNGATNYTYPGVDVVSAGTVGGLTNCVVQTGIDVSPSGTAYNLMAVEFETDAPTVEALLYGTSNTAANIVNSAFFSIEVDGEMVTADPYATALTESAWNRITIAFGSVKRRRIIIRAQYVQFGGVAVDATKYKVWKSARNPGPKTIVFMDSFGTGGSSTDNTFATPAVLPWVWGSFAIKCGRILGWNTFPSPVGGTGWYYDGGFGQSVANRYDTDGHARLPDQVVFAIGLNDRAQTLSSVQTAINNTIQAAAASVNAQGRKTKVFALAPICTIPASLTALTTIAGYVSTACSTYGGTYISGPLSYISGSGWVGGTTGDGNADIYLSPDRIHLMPAGYDYIGRRLAGEIAEASRANRIGNQALDSGLIPSGHVIEDEGTPLTTRSNLNFTGAGVAVTDAGGKTVVTIAGSTGLPARDGCSLYRDTDYTWTPTTGYETIPWTQELFDDNAYHSTVSNTDRITIPTGMGGTYEFIANIHVTRSTANAVQVRIKKNGSTSSTVAAMMAGNYSAGGGDTRVVLAHSGPVVMAAGDYITVEVYPDGSGTAVVNKDWSWFRMRRIA